MREGQVFKRCGKCRKTIAPDARTCGTCGYRGFSWAFVVDIGPLGAPRQQRKQQGFATKSEALAALNELQRDASRGLLVGRDKRTTAEYLREWIQTVRPPRLRSSTFATYKIHVETLIVPALGDVPLQALTRAAIKSFYADLATSGRRHGKAGLSEKTIHNTHIVLRVALEAAVEDGVLVRNPAAKAHKLPAGATAERRTWTEDELRTFLSHVRTDRLAALWRLAATTGMRRGELLALQWPDADLEAGTLTIQRSRALGEGGEIVEGSPKTGRGRRTIDLDSQTIAAMREHRTRQLQERLAWGEGYAEGRYIFTRENGEPLRPDSVSDRFEVLCRGAGLVALGLHSLRHLHGSVMLRAGVPLHIVSRRLGHANESFTASVYAHVLPGQQAEAARAFATAIDDGTRESVTNL